MAQVTVNKKELYCLIDSGATCNVIGMPKIRKIFDDPRNILIQNNGPEQIKVFGGETMKVRGNITLEI